MKLRNVTFSFELTADECTTFSQVLYSISKNATEADYVKKFAKELLDLIPLELQHTRVAERR
jgi:hypothetical protein